MEGWKRRPLEPNLNSWANDLDIYCDGEAGKREGLVRNVKISVLAMVSMRCL